MAVIPEYYEFQNPVKLLSGKNALENIPFELKNLGCAKPAILTNKQLRGFGFVDMATAAFTDHDITCGLIYDDIPQDSSIGVVNAIAGEYRRNGCDGVIAIGGGSVIDSAKGLALNISQGTDDIMALMGNEIITRKNKVPFIVVPTTAGTGSEATLVAVIANPKENVKMEFLSYNLLPDVAVLDVRMTLSLPPRITASTGMDALCHAIESYTCLQKNPLSDAYAVAAIELIRDHLLKVTQDPKNEDARLAMANAATMAGAAFSNSMVGVIHAIGHACGGVSHIPHGDAMAILLPFGMEYNLDKAGDQYANLLLPLCGEEVYCSTPKEQRAIRVIEEVRALTQKLHDLCGLPLRLSEEGVTKEQLPAIAETAINDGAMLMNPKDAGVEEVMGILGKAL